MEMLFFFFSFFQDHCVFRPIFPFSSIFLSELSYRKHGKVEPVQQFEKKGRKKTHTHTVMTVYVELRAVRALTTQQHGKN